ncbi:MAG TPA: AI-2E family transporter [Patescibacteria group bacterium]|nr:AI-2E family transporter [Patescibacteria group bacterium]
MDFTKIRNYLFIGSLLLVTVLFLRLLQPFGYAIFWAATIAGLSYPLYQRILHRLKRPNLSSAITLSLITIIIILPIIMIGALVVRESFNLFRQFQDNQEHIRASVQETIQNFKTNSYFARLNIDEALVAERVSEMSNDAINFILQKLKDFTFGSATFAISFLIMLYTLFFFLRDGERLLKKLMFLIPLGDKYESMLYNKFTTTARSTIKGTLVIGAIQGTLGGLLFALTGVPGALFWGIIMTLLSSIPGIGSFFIWLPAAIIMLALGNIWQGLVIIAVGTLIIGTIDNFLRPLLVGRDLRIHPLLILFSTLGGILLFNISGFVIGPVIASLLLAFWEMYEHYYKSELAHN